jgi:hypothetical protein
MAIDPLFVNELRALFKAGATPSSLVRRIAERFPDEPQIDRLVRAYFREAFHIPLLRVGNDLIIEIAQGGACPALNHSLVHRMVATRSDWDKPIPEGETPPASWMDSVTATDESEMSKRIDAGTIPEFAEGWPRLSEEAKRYITRVIANANTLYEQVQVLAVLAEQLQQRLHAAEDVEARGG